MVNNKEEKTVTRKAMCKRCKYEFEIETTGKIKNVYCTGPSGSHHPKQEMQVYE